MVSPGADSRKLTLRALTGVYLRSFFSQGSFSIRYRQNVGFAFCLEPAGKEIWQSDEDRRKFYLRHLEYYNGNPFMVTLVLGAVARMEERLRDDDGMKEEDINRFKTAVGQAVGSVGDRLFWRTLRPFSLVLGLFAAYRFGVWGALVFLAAFNLPLFWLKWYWLMRGYTLGPRVVIEIKNPKIDPATRFMETAGGMVLSFLVVVLLAMPGYRWSPASAGTAALFLLGFLLPGRRIPPSVVLVISAILAVLLGWAIV